MAKAENHWQREAAAAAAAVAERIDAGRETGQLSLFEGDEGGGDGAGVAAGKRGKGKALSSLRGRQKLAGKPKQDGGGHR